jgi:hypothetical protein
LEKSGQQSTQIAFPYLIAISCRRLSSHSRCWAQ